MTRTSVGLSVALTLLASTANAQSVDFISQDLSVDISTPTDTTVTIDLTVEATASVTQLNMLNPALEIVSAEVDGVTAITAPHPTYPAQVTNLIYPTPLTAGQQATITLVLSGPVTCSQSGALCLREADQTLFTAPSPGAAWYLVNIWEDDPFVGGVEVLAPDTHVVTAGHGPPLAVDAIGGGVQRWQFELQATQLFGMYAGIADTLDGDDGFSISAIYDQSRHDEEDVSLAVETAGAVLPLMEAYYGALPISHANIITVPSNFAFGAMGILGNVFVNEVVFTTHDYLVVQGMAHEFAHSWWGNLATAHIIEEARYFGEAFAEYSAWRALGDLHGAETRLTGMRMNATYYMYRRPNDVDVAILSPSAVDSPAYVFATYHKGALVTRALEEIVGAEAFGSALRSFAARGIGGLGVAELIEDVQAASGFDATAFTDQWLRREGFPRVAVTPAVEGDTARLAIDVPDYDLHIPIVVRYADGTSEVTAVDVTAGTSEHTLPLQSHPAAIEIDPAWTMAREINNPQPADVTFDGEVDAADLIEIALRHGSWLPFERRVDGAYDPVFDIDRDGTVGDADLDTVSASVQ